MSFLINDTDLAVKVFNTPNKSYEDLEYLLHFLSQFKELKRYFDLYNLQHQFQIIESFKLKPFSSEEVIFRKGDISIYYYFILQGLIEAFNEERDGSTKLIGVVGVGKPLGEIGILRNQPRSLTCIAKTNGFYLLLNSEKFLNLLAPGMFANLDSKIKFIETYFPNVKKLTMVQKQRIAYAMSSVTMARGMTVSNIGDTCPHLFFIGEGELLVTLGSQVDMKLKLAPGNLIGEECVFFNILLRYNIIVSSEYTLLYTIPKQDIFHLLPIETINIWKTNFRAKDRSRKQIALNFNQNYKKNNTIYRTTSNFKQASRVASRRLDTIQKLNEIISSSDDMGKKNSFICMKLKQFSPAAVISNSIFSATSTLNVMRISRTASKLVRINESHTGTRLRLN
jgi:CRP-like cAMP-binding protein